MKRLFVIAILLLVAASAFAHRVEVVDGDYVVTHEWDHDGRRWQCTLGVPVELYEYYQGRTHVSDRLVEFVLSDHDRYCITSLAGSFEGDIGNVVSFVQSLRYVSDDDSKGEDEYVRFPVETLVDGCGDCEDLAILAAAILDAMGYGVMLVGLPDHLALAVACGDEGCEGTYYEFDGVEYYYLEVTSTGWAIGQVPDVYASRRARLTPLVRRPHMRVRRCVYRHENYYDFQKEVPFEVNCELENSGPGTTQGLTIRVVVTTRKGKVRFERAFAIDELGEGERSTYKLKCNIPRPLHGRMMISAEGANFDAVSLEFDDFELK